MTDTTPLPSPLEQTKVPVSPAPSASEQPEPETKAESTPAAEGSEEAGTEPKHEDKPKRSASGRIAELFAQKKEAEARAQSHFQENQRLRNELARIQQAMTDPNVPIEQQDELRVRAAVKAERVEQLQAEAAFQQRVMAERRQEAFLQKAQEHIDRMPDFYETVSSIPISEVAAELIAESDVGPQVAYHLGKNPDLARRLASMPPHVQGKEIARIEQKVSAPVRKVSQAQAPLPRVGGGSSPAAKDPAQMSDSEYSAWYRSRRKG